MQASDTLSSKEKIGKSSRRTHEPAAEGKEVAKIITQPLAATETEGVQGKRNLVKRTRSPSFTKFLFPIRALRLLGSEVDVPEPKFDMQIPIKRPRLRQLHPAQIIALSFILVIVVGTILLSLPLATRSATRISLVDAFFTITSATCVTGLVVTDTGTTFSLFGQLVILSCIQIGGLGLMTFTTVFLVALGQRLSITDRIAVQESFHHTRIGNPVPLIKHIALATFTIEAMGAAALMLYWLRTDRFATLGQTIYMALFHSISAFCNAGFTLFSDNLMGFQRDPFVQLVITTLIVTGGLGFLVGLDLRKYAQQKLLQRLHPHPALAASNRPRLSVHTKFVLLTTGALLVIGTLSYYLLERHGVFVNLSEAEAWLNAYFCAVTPRTAGFNTVDYTQMSGAALLCTMVMMIIGASPGSTGGGIKTSTFALLVAYSISRWRGHSHLHAFKRTVPQEAIDRAAAVVVAAIALLIIASSVLMVTETYGARPDESQRRFLSLLFETISAFGTVGLSLNYTPLLTTAGKIVISLVMFMGRIGPLTLALAISLRQRRAQYRYAEENVMVG